MPQRHFRASPDRAEEKSSSNWIVCSLLLFVPLLLIRAFGRRSRLGLSVRPPFWQPQSPKRRGTDPLRYAKSPSVHRCRIYAYSKSRHRFRLGFEGVWKVCTATTCTLGFSPLKTFGMKNVGAGIPLLRIVYASPRSFCEEFRAAGCAWVP